MSFAFNRIVCIIHRNFNIIQIKGSLLVVFGRGTGSNNYAILFCFVTYQILITSLEKSRYTLKGYDCTELIYYRPLHDFMFSSLFYYLVILCRFDTHASFHGVFHPLCIRPIVVSWIFFISDYLTIFKSYKFQNHLWELVLAVSLAAP